ncbi:MAG: hypothetical protein JRI39_00630 [Deltaproteobacteria bacterium]|nr:hypothetical protein [Deltaproteobacteria bacterium]
MEVRDPYWYCRCGFVIEVDLEWDTVETRCPFCGRPMLLLDKKDLPCGADYD